MALGDAAFSQGDLMRRIKALEDEVRTMRAARTLENASIGKGGIRVKGSGGITLQNGGGLTVEDGGNIAVEGGDVSVLAGGNIKITDGALIVYNGLGQKIVELGSCADGRHGLQVYKANGTRVLRAGELASGSEGLELINDLGQLVRVDTLAFGTKAAAAPASLPINSGSYVALSGGPSVPGVVVGNSGRCLVHLSCWILAGGHAAENAQMGFAMSGPTAVAATDANAISLGGINGGIGRAILVTGLSPGTYTVEARYKGAVGGGFTPQVFNRHLAVTPF